MKFGMVAVHVVVKDRELSVGVPMMIEAAGRKKRPSGAVKVLDVGAAIVYVVPAWDSNIDRGHANRSTLLM